MHVLGLLDEKRRTCRVYTMTATDPAPEGVAWSGPSSSRVELGASPHTSWGSDQIEVSGVLSDCAVVHLMVAAAVVVEHQVQ